MSAITAAVIDIETTGLDSAADAIVEIAAIAVALDTERPAPADAVPETLFNSLVKPDRPIPPTASAVHNITDAAVADSDPFGIVYPKLVSALRDFGPDILVAHNAPFEARFLPDLAAAVTGDDPRWVCTAVLARHLWPDAPGFSNQVLRYWRGLSDCASGTDVHRAAFDATCTAYLLVDEIAAIKARGRVTEVTAKHLRDATEIAPLLATVPFGAHRGSHWSQVPRDYCEWIVSRVAAGDTGFSPSVIKSAKAALAGRYATDPPKTE